MQLFPEGHADPRTFTGRHKLQLPSPSLCLSLPIIKENARIFHEKVQAAGVDFRAHVKTTKTLEVARILIGSHQKVVVSNLREVRGLRPLIEEGLVTDVLYGVPIGPSQLPEIDEFCKDVKMRLLIDDIDHVPMLSQYTRLAENKTKPWSVFIKLDLSTDKKFSRAGLPPQSEALKELIRAVEAEPKIELYGFYTYSSNAAESNSVQEAQGILGEHTSTVLSMLDSLSDKTQPITLSIGSSPTANVIQPLARQLPANITLEIHAGTLIYNDLQQLSTRTLSSPSLTTSHLAMTLITEICARYPHRNEALISAGVLALTREPGRVRGIATIRDHEGWVVDRVTQEHGVVAFVGGGDGEEDVKREFELGENIELDVQHACIVGAMHGWHFVTDGEGVVRDVWWPWKWW